MGDLFLCIALIATVLFIYSAILSYDASDAVSKGELGIADLRLDNAEWFGLAGWFITFVEILFIAFSVGLFHGAIVSAVTATSFILWWKHSE